MSKIPVLNTLVPAGDFKIAHAKDIEFSCKESVAEAIERLDAGASKSVTYAELVAMRDTKKLSAGEMYRITDYEFICKPTTRVCDGLSSANHPFDIIVTATSNNELSEVASAARRDGDTYFKDAKLEAWELRYILDNDEERAEWVTPDSKGVIVYMKDEHNNECPYDFKNALFRRYMITAVSNEAINLLIGKYAAFEKSDSHFDGRITIDGSDYIDCYTFTDIKNGIVRDLTITQSQICRDNKNNLVSSNKSYIMIPNNVWTNGLVPEGVTPSWDGCRQINITRGHQNTMGYWCFISAQYGFDFNIMNYCRHMDFGNTTRNNIVANDGTEENIFGFNITSPQGLLMQTIGNERTSMAHFMSEIHPNDIVPELHTGLAGHAEGYCSYAVGNTSHAEGHKTQALGNISHAEGQLTVSEGTMSHAEGNKTEAKGSASHAEGQRTHSEGAVSHAEGEDSVSSGRCSHAGGTGTVADAFNMTAVGMYNNPSANPTTDKTRGEYAFVIGNGTDDTHRSNALAVKWDGTLVLGNVSITPAQLQQLLSKL